MSATNKRVAIIGGGVIGLSTAYFCAERGHDVTVIDGRDEAIGGSTAGNAGMIVPSHFIPLAAPGMVKLGLKWMWNPESPFYIKPRLNAELLGWGWKFWRAANAKQVARAAPALRDLHMASRSLFETLAERQEFGLVKKGLLMLCQSQHTLDDEGKMAETARQLGVPAEVLDAKATARLDPGARMDIVGAVYFPKDCHLAPDRFLQALRMELQKLGSKIMWNSPVNRINRKGGRITTLETAKGEIRADEFVLCGGSWSSEIARELGLGIPLQAGKGYSVTVSNPRQLPEICSILTEARVAVTPIGRSLRFGGTMEIAGLNEEVSERRVRGIINAAVRYYPEFRVEDFAGLQPWRGLRPCSPDGMPYLGRTKRWSNFSVATGHGMMGLSLAPITGRLMSEIITGEAPSIDVSLLDPDRYG